MSRRTALPMFWAITRDVLDPLPARTPIATAVACLAFESHGWASSPPTVTHLSYSILAICV